MHALHALLLLAVSLHSQEPPDPGQAVAWSITANGSGCPSVSAIPTMQNVLAQCGGPMALDIDGCIPSQPFLVTAELGITPGLGCILGLTNVVYFGFANPSGTATLTITFPAEVDPSILPHGTNYVGFLQVVSFASLIEYATSGPMLIHATN